MKNPKGRPKGYVMSDEEKKKISDSMTGKKRSKEIRKKISKGVKREGKPSISLSRVLKTNLKKANKIKRSGYINVYIPWYGNKRTGNYMREHVAIIEQKLGRKLKRGEQVHHWSTKDNNNPIVLTLCKSIKHHNRLDKAKANLYRYLNKNNFFKNKIGNI